MKTFPDKLKPQNRIHFEEYKFNRELCKLRQKIVDYLYSGDKGGFDLKSTIDDNKQYSYSHIDDKIIEFIRKELHVLGWKTKMMFGNTTLFIYDDENEIPTVDGETIE